MSNTTQYGNTDINVADILRLAALAGPIGEDDAAPDTLYLKFERPTYTRAEVIELVQVIARIRPDECDLDASDLRLWWD